MPSLGGVGRDFVSGVRVSAIDTRKRKQLFNKKYSFEGAASLHVLVAVSEASGLPWRPTYLAFRTPIRVAWIQLDKRNFATVLRETARANGHTRRYVCASRNCSVSAARATVRDKVVGTPVSAPSGNNSGIAGAHEIRHIFTNTAAIAQSVRANFVSAAA